MAQESTKANKIKKKKNWKVIIPSAIVGLVVFYIVVVYFLVSAALIPSFMQKFEFFNTITDLCLDQQVHSSDIEQNLKAGADSYQKWLDEMDFQRETVETEDGYTLVATRLDAEDPASHLWALVLHGYTGWKEEMYPYARMYRRYGFNCIVPDLRTQGESEGDFIGMGWTDHYDCMLWIDRILAIDPDAKIVLHGQSMGAATVLMMTGEEDLSDHVVAAVSEASYTDAYTMFGDKLNEWFHLPAFPFIDSAVLMMKVRGAYDLHKASAIDAVKKSHIPTLFIHGDMDAMISVDMAYELYEAEAAPKELLIIEGAGHAQCKHKDPDLFVSTVIHFVAPYVQ